MEKARKRLRVCLICVVAIAVVLGTVYYFRDAKPGKRVSEGTLITISEGSSLIQSFGMGGVHHGFISE